MNFSQSQQILDRIKESSKILLACHQGVDPDSMVSCLIMKKAISELGKEVDIICGDDIPKEYQIFDPNKEVQENVDINKFDFKKYDLFLTLDINDWKRIGISDPSIMDDIEVINIDHHLGNSIEALKISDTSYSSTVEMLFYLLEDWNIELDEKMLQWLLIGIITDTDSFNYGSSARVFKTVSRLLELGANYDEAATLIYRNNSELKLKYWAKMLSNLKVDKENKFAYTSISHEDYQEFGELLHPTRLVADNFIRTIEDTNYGVVMVEEVKGELKISVRSKGKYFGVMDLLVALGGGGHFTGGGAMIKDMEFNQAVDKVLEACRVFSSSHK